MTKRSLISLVFLGGWLLVWQPITHLPVAAQQGSSEITVVSNEAVDNFPHEVTFHLELEGDTPIPEATLAYDVAQFSCLETTAQVPVEVTGSSLEWTWVMSRSGNPPPGAELWWQWTLTDADGNTFTTPRQTLTFTDERFDWRTVSAEGIQLYWYAGDEVGPTLLQAAVSGLRHLESDMGIQLQGDAQIYIYGSAEDMRQAVLYVQGWAGGVAFSEHNTILMGVPPRLAESWGRSTIRHELAHLVIGQFARSCVGGRRPTWLEEGLAVYAEGEPQESVLEDIDRGIRNNSFEPLRSLNGAFPAHDSAASMAYSQSFSVVNFLLQEYGQEMLQELLLTLARGRGYDEALQEVYGFNVDGLEVAWRQAVGAPSRPIPPTPTPLSAAGIATVAPMGAPHSIPTPEAAAPLPAAPQSSPGLCGIGLIPLLLLAAAAMVRAPRRDELDSVDS